MAYEVKPWKKEGCSLAVKTFQFSDRETFSQEINEAYGEGGGLNADYRTVDTALKVTSILRGDGLEYGEDFVFKTAGVGEIIFDFATPEIKKRAENFLEAVLLTD
ncbi:hypothetical protein MYX06_02175 [Patescibacteria group bacterium AH-259-L05]|nr:hypothetical protein [Patescibacteria group bacterium AH-259-L05]